VRRAVLKMTAKAKGVHNVESDVVDPEWPPVGCTVSLYAAAAAGRRDAAEAGLGGQHLTHAKALADAGKPVLEWDREWFGRSPLHAAAMGAMSRRPAGRAGENVARARVVRLCCSFLWPRPRAWAHGRGRGG
jgi:hypothetical protein